MDKLQQTQSFYSDFHKDLYGFRPRPSADRWNDLAWLDAQIERLLDDEPRVEAEKKAEEDAAIAAFEALVQKTIESGAADRETAIRWIRQSGDEYEQNDDGFFEYTRRLPYGYLKRSAG